MSIPHNYFGTNQPLPVSHLLHAGALSCLYERGQLRYIKIGDTEIIRMIYTAVRDNKWITIPYNIIEENIDIQPCAFSISCTALYAMDGLKYKAILNITGKNNTINFTFKGIALSDFSRNRIGLCVLHPIKECIGKSCSIKAVNGKKQTLQFPKQISPHQPFKNIMQMQWQPNETCTAILKFEGDTFETEDQRNWTDASYKTYSTPLDLPYPVELIAGDTVTQSVTLKVDTPDNPDISKKDIHIQITGNKFKFPLIGYSKSLDKLTTQQIGLLKKIPFNTYRIEIHFDSDWRHLLEQALNEASDLNTCLSIVIFFKDIDRQVQEVISALKNRYNIIDDILILNAGRKTTCANTMNKVYPLFKWIFPGIKIGAGTDGHFTEWNREPLTGIATDFICYSVNPQAHTNDTRTLIENLEAQQYTLIKANIINPRIPVHVSPITLKSRREPRSKHDARQSSIFNAAWTLLSIKYLAGAASLTYFETTGKDGLMNGNKLFPVYDFLTILKNFRPVYIHETSSNTPLNVDALIVENRTGNKLHFIINFSELPAEISLNGFQNKLILPPTSITVKQLQLPAIYL